MSGTPWSPADTAWLRKVYPDFSTAILARQLRRTERSVYQHARALGLSKSAAYLASPIARRWDGQRGGATRFKPNATPWNKGLKGSTGTQEECRRTQFQKGAMAGAAQHNYVPVGSLRTTRDGYLEQKLTDDPSLAPARRWVAVHRIVWEQERGPIPAGHIVVFRRGMKTATQELITVERLECISRAENARRNHPRNKSPELAQLVQLKGAITRQVNRIAREAKEAAA